MAIALLVFATGCGDTQARAVNVVGSTSIQPFAELLAQEYDARHPGETVEVQGGGSTAGLQTVTNGLADIGMCSRGLTPEESQQFQATVIARDGLAIVINRKNPVDSLTTAQLRELFSGTITNWSAVGGHDGPVRPITREEIGRASCRERV